VIASRRELVAYDRLQNNGCDVAVGLRRPSESMLAYYQDAAMDLSPEVAEAGAELKASRCYGCSCAATEFCVKLLQVLTTDPALRDELCRCGLLRELLDANLKRGSAKVCSVSALHNTYHFHRSD
jgi:hypothetical protein